jgi:hypothetical protein
VPRGAAASSRGPRPFVLTSFLSNTPRSDSWHRLGRNFASAYIRTYLPVALGRGLCSPFPTLSSVGVTRFRPYPPFGRYQVSLGHARLFPTVSPAHTVVRWGGTLCLRLHSAGSTIPHLGPTGSSVGWLPSITTRWFSASPSDPTSRWAPCPPESCERWLQVPLGCLPLSRSCPCRVLHTCLSLRPVRRYPHLWISTRGPGPSGTLTRLRRMLPGTHYDPIRHPPAIRAISLSGL